VEFALLCLFLVRSVLSKIETRRAQRGITPAERILLVATLAQ
jgi:hypothetical protein